MTKATFYNFDKRRQIAVPGDRHATLKFAVEHWMTCALNAIKDHGAFYVALSGGSTPKAIYESLASHKNREKIEWPKVHLFWSDERSVAPDDPESNYRMAMDAGLKELVPEPNIHRMIAEREIEKNAAAYEALILKILGPHPFDLIMLGMGEDGHTASLFPRTDALNESKHQVVANRVPQKKTNRMTMTFPCLNRASNLVIYVLGESKKEMVSHIFTDTVNSFPAQQLGTPTSKSLWILDKAAAELIESQLKG